MSAADVSQAIGLGIQIAKAIASAFGLDEHAVIKVARDEVAKLSPSPPDQSKTYFEARKIAAEQDERSELDRAPARSRQVGALGIHVQRNDAAHDTDPAMPAVREPGEPSER